MLSARDHRDADILRMLINEYLPYRRKLSRLVRRPTVDPGGPQHRSGFRRPARGSCRATQGAGPAAAPPSSCAGPALLPRRQCRIRRLGPDITVVVRAHKPFRTGDTSTNSEVLAEAGEQGPARVRSGAANGWDGRAFAAFRYEMPDYDLPRKTLSCAATASVSGTRSATPISTRSWATSPPNDRGV